MPVECHELQQIRWEVAQQTMIENAIHQIRLLDYESPKIDEARKLLYEECEVLEERIQSHFE